MEKMQASRFIARYLRRDQETQSTSHQCSKQSPAFLQQQTPHHRDKDTHHEYIHRANLYVQFRNLDDKQVP